MDQRSGVVWFSGWIMIFVIYSCISMPNFEVLDARIASALNKIIHNSHFKRRSSLEEQKAQKQDRFLRGRQIAYLICEYFRVTGANDSVENYADLFTIGLRNDDIQEFDSKWDGKVIINDENPTWWYLGRIVQIKNTRVGELKTVLELYDLEIHQKKIGPDHHRLKTMVKRSIEQDIRNKIFAPETEIMKETPWSRIRNKTACTKNSWRLWQWESNGQCSGGDNCSCRHDINKRAKMTQPNPSPNSFHAAEWEKCVEIPKSQWKESQW